MGGGKETPRQKMIGMMYLVLTALLALNVSKAILDAFVAIEENTQKSSITHLDRGNAAKSELAAELADKMNPVEKLAKVKYYLGIIDQIDKETAERIKFIDEIKVKLLEKSGEDVVKIADKEKEAIIWKKYDKKNPLLPARLNLMAVQAKDQYDVPMEVMIGENLKSPKGDGIALWKSFNDYRGKLVDLVGSYKAGDKGNWVFKSTPINTFKDNADLNKKVDAMMAKNKKFNVNDDGQVIKQIYSELTKSEMVEMEEGPAHWIGKTFDHAPLVAAIASLTAMQQEILSARATAVAHIKGRVSTGEYSFNKILPLAYGPMIANANEEVELKVMMAAYDSDNQPVVTGPGSITVADGQGIIKMKTGSSDMNLSGTVAIRNKSGVEKKENWTHTIKIMKPEGTVTLPEMNVLYRGYKNVVTGVASGYDQTVLTGTTNVSLSKSGATWIGSPGAGTTAVITVSGKSSVTNKTVSLGKFEFRVKALPKPSIFVGSTASGGKISTNPGGLNAGYPPEIPLKAQFSVLDWEASVTGIMGKKKGQGSSLQGIGSLLGQAKPGSMVIIEAGVRGPDGKVNRIYETFKL